MAPTYDVQKWVLLRLFEGGVTPGWMEVGDWYASAVVRAQGQLHVQRGLRGWDREELETRLGELESLYVSRFRQSMVVALVTCVEALVLLDAIPETIFLPRGWPVWDAATRSPIERWHPRFEKCRWVWTLTYGDREFYGVLGKRKGEASHHFVDSSVVADSVWSWLGRPTDELLATRTASQTL